MKRSAVIVAGGESSRFEKNKLFASLFGKTLIEITVGNFIGIADEIVLVVNPKDMQRMTLLFSMLDYLGIERERTRVEWVSAAEGAKFAATMNDFVETITRLGENKRLEDLRCKN